MAVDVIITHDNDRTLNEVYLRMEVMVWPSNPKELPMRCHLAAPQIQTSYCIQAPIREE